VYYAGYQYGCVARRIVAHSRVAHRCAWTQCCPVVRKILPNYWVFDVLVVVDFGNSLTVTRSSDSERADGEWKSRRQQSESHPANRRRGEPQSSVLQHGRSVYLPDENSIHNLYGRLLHRDCDLFCTTACSLGCILRRRERARYILAEWQYSLLQAASSYHRQHSGPVCSSAQ